MQRRAKSKRKYKSNFCNWQIIIKSQIFRWATEVRVLRDRHSMNNFPYVMKMKNAGSWEETISRCLAESKKLDWDP